MILGMNVLEFVLVAWIGCVALVWIYDYGPEIYVEQKTEWRKSHPKKERVSENTVTLPVGSFDPDSTMKLPKIRKDELQHVFVMSKRPVKPAHGRHAKG
jgi:hypothetical protein